MLFFLYVVLTFLGFIFIIVQKKVKFNFITGLFFGLSYLIATGFRSIDVGEDSMNYYHNYFLIANEFNSIFDLFERDVVFKLLNYIILIFGSDWYYYAFFMSSILLFFTVKVNSLTKDKDSYLFVILLVTCPIFIENTINIIRTTLCSLIMFFGYLYLNKNKKFGLFIILIGFCVHYLQGIILIIFMITSKIDIIRTNKNFNFYLGILFLFLISKNVLSIFNFEILLNKLELMQITLTNNFNSPYRINQIIGSKDKMTLSMLLQVILYFFIPLFCIDYDKIDSNKKKLINYASIMLVSYVILIPQFTFAVRLLPITLFIIISVFTHRMNKTKIVYSISILSLNLIIAFKNIYSW